MTAKREQITGRQQMDRHYDSKEITDNRKTTDGQPLWQTAKKQQTVDSKRDDR